MAATKTASQPTTKSTTAPTARPCWKYYQAHDPHTHKSTLTKADHTCKGEKMTWPEYSKAIGNGAYVPVVLKDYTKTTDAKGNPWIVAGGKEITVNRARAIAFDMHSSQKDKSGLPYHEHLSAVEAGVVVLGGSDEERIAALFHDAVEDHHTTYKHLAEIGCTPHTVTLIEAVSKRKSEEQNAYLARIIAAGQGAMRVKVSDLLHNTRHDRMQALRDSGKGITADRLLKKYRPALASLMLALTLIVDEDDQRKLATKPVGTSPGTYASTGSTSTGSTYKPKPQTMGVKGLIVGDWPKGWNAPIMSVHHHHTIGSTTFTLANGEIRTEAWETAKGNARKVPVFLQYAWTGASSVEPVEGLNEDDYRQFESNVEAAKARRGQGTLPLDITGGTTPLWEAEGNDSWTGWAG